MNLKPVDILTRRAGVTVPLSALRSRDDAGIGDTAALMRLLDWMPSSGLSVLQLLPLSDLAPKDSCPYTAVSAFALDSAYISLPDVPEIRDSAPLRSELEAAMRGPEASRLRASPRVRFGETRAFKRRFLEKAFPRFEDERGRGGPRTEAFRAFAEAQSAWLADYALFRALKEETGWRPWNGWPAGLRDREPEALAAARARLQERIRLHEYLQWLTFEQWAEVRRRAAARGVLLFGDIPFGLNRESADVWARAGEYELSASMGAPPDQYSATGQAWGLPAYRWAGMEAGGHIWWRRRLRQARELYDLIRMDHAVGFFRTWLIYGGKRDSAFDIEGAEPQRERGRRFFGMCVEEAAPARVVGEDLGVIPEYVPEVLAELEVPGYRVTRWESDDGVFRDPRGFPALSVAAHSNHDTSTLATWWREVGQAHRDAYWRMVTGKAERAPRFSHTVHRRLIENLYAAGSGLALLLFQDAFGTRERINVPATVSARNWTYRVAWNAEELSEAAIPAQKTAMLKDLALRTGRLSY
ncbi:MAG: 4-alpha-glucanotransferase [Elusimicrobiota bacterium]